MANGVTAARKLQFGRETTAGTAVAATFVWPGMGMISPDIDVKNVAQNDGNFQPTNLYYIPRVGATIELDPVEATFDLLPHILEMGIMTATPAQDGTGGATGYTRDYLMPLTASRTIKTYTIEGGDNQLCQEVEYCFVESFKITGKASEGVMMSAKIRGRQTTDTTFTSSQVTPALIPSDVIVFGGSNIYIDAAGGTIGSTEKTSTLLSFELDVTTGQAAKYTNLAKSFDFSYFNKGAYKATLKMVYEHNATADAERDKFEAATPGLIRLKFTGAAFADVTGATYGAYTLIIDCAGVYTSFERGDVDGNSTVEVEMALGLDQLTAPDQGLRILVANELSALP